MYFSKIILKLNSKLSKREFLKNVMTLMTGTIVAQVVTAGISPVLTRMYTPSDFGVYALFLSINSILAVMVAGRYELAIVLPEKRADGLSIMVLCIGLSVFTSTLLMLIIAIGGEYISLLFNTPDLQRWLIFIPCSTFMAVVYQSLYYWFNRTQQYSVMSRSRVLSAIFNAGGSIILGLYHFGVAGLILGLLLGQFVSITVMVYIFIKQEKNAISNLSIENIYEQAKRYIDFPKFLIISHSINSLSSQLPVILLNTFFGATVVGYFSLAQRVVSIPLGLIAQSVGDVFRQRASDEYKAKGSCPIIYKKTLKTLATLGILPCLFLLFVAPHLFGLVFGEAWIEAGYYVQILTVMFYFQLISGPLSMMYMIAEKQSKDLILQICIVSSSFFAIYLGWYYGQKPEWSVLLFSINYSIIYILNVYITKRWAYAT